jgi:hypothetical protein
MPVELLREYTLVYGMKLFEGRAAEGGPHVYLEVATPQGKRDRMALHTIVGTREEIRQQMLASVEAFFELCDATPER